MKKHARSLVRVLSDQIGRNKVRLGAEIGVWQGELSADLLRSFPNLFLRMYDVWRPFEGTSMHDKDNTEEAMLEAMELARRNTDFASSRRSLHRTSSVYGAFKFYNSLLDFVFLDADHFYESVKADIVAWWPKIRVGGIFAGHDYDGMGDRRKGWGIKRAVDEFFAEQLGLEVRVEPGLVWWVKKP